MGLQLHERRCAALRVQGAPGSVLSPWSMKTCDSATTVLVLAPPAAASAATETSSSGSVIPGVPGQTVTKSLSEIRKNKLESVPGDTFQAAWLF